MELKSPVKKSGQHYIFLPFFFLYTMLKHFKNQKNYCERFYIKTVSLCYFFGNVSFKN